MIVNLLNKALADELQAVHQYLYFHFHCDSQGLEKYAGLFKKTAMAEMQHVEKLADRIIFLGGDVEMDQHFKVEKIREVKDMLELARKMEEGSVKEYNSDAARCQADAISKQLFEQLIGDEEKHFNEFDTELSNIDRFGDNYLALQSLERKVKP